MGLWDNAFDPESGVRLERTGWRSQNISRKHRDWGISCSAVDLDFVLCEFNYNAPVAIVEYKERHAAPVDLSHGTYQALKALADGHTPKALPFIIARYDEKEWWFIPQAGNAAAEQFFAQMRYDGNALTEREWATMLILMRKRQLDARDKAAIAKLHNTKPYEAIGMVEW